MIKTNIDYKDKIIDSFKDMEASAAAGDIIWEERRNAIEAFEDAGLPTRKHEEWKYTNIHPYLKEAFAPRITTTTPVVSEEEIMQGDFDNLKANKLVFINGIFSTENSSILEKEKLKFSSLKNELKQNGSIIKNAVRKQINRDKDAFMYLNTVFMQDGAVIEIGENITLQYPVYLLFIDKGSDGNFIDQPRNVFLIGKNSNVKFITNYLNFSGSGHFLNIFTQIDVAENADVDFYALQCGLKESIHLNFLEVVMDKNSRFNSYYITTSGALVRNNMNIVMGGENGEAHMYGLYQLDGKEHVDNRTLIDHAVPNCYSNELYKGILKDNSIAVFNGKIIVRPDAQKTNAFQHNANILLSDTASINAKPQLEIFADDVKCSHGATSGQLDENALFYLRARGLGEEDAKAFLTYAFANEVVDNIKIKEIKDFLAKHLQGRLMIHE